VVLRCKWCSSHSEIVSIQAIVKTAMNLFFSWQIHLKQLSVSGCQKGPCSIQWGRQFCMCNFVGTKNLSKNKQENNVQLHRTRKSRLAHANLLHNCLHHTLSVHRHFSLENVPIYVWLSTDHQSECRIAHWFAEENSPHVETMVERNIYTDKKILNSSLHDKLRIT
jgi:hypothetical protein